MAGSDTVALAAAQAIRDGDVDALRRLLRDRTDLAEARIGPRTLLHVATDWPGHFPNVAESIAVLASAGADVNAAFSGPKHAETPLHWAASSDDVAALDALLDAGANIEAPGSLFSNGTALADAVAFGQWKAARRLIERGARPNLWQAAALGLLPHVEAELLRRPDAHEITRAFWCACHGGQRAAAELLLERGADLNWVGYDGLTPLDAAQRSGAGDVVEWLRERGAKSANAPR